MEQSCIGRETWGQFVTGIIHDIDELEQRIQTLEIAKQND